MALDTKKQQTCLIYDKTFFLQTKNGFFWFSALSFNSLSLSLSLSLPPQSFLLFTPLPFVLLPLFCSPPLFTLQPFFFSFVFFPLFPLGWAFVSNFHRMCDVAVSMSIHINVWTCSYLRPLVDAIRRKDLCGHSHP